MQILNTTSFTSLYHSCPYPYHDKLNSVGLFSSSVAFGHFLYPYYDCYIPHMGKSHSLSVPLL